ncbi:MAG TPA: ABC transporter ATP-binding protein, partial [Anaerolineales bacterium]|nr:ABC transporter ATP-binding protein [Anaerolineales bacterium]
MLVVDDIHTFYGDSHVLQGVSLRVGAGEAVALLGRNGVGKSTTIKSIIGFTPPQQGVITIDETDISATPSHRIAQLGVGLVPQGRSVFPTLSVRENLTMAMRNTNGGGWSLARVLETFPSLEKRQKNLGSQLSGGEQQMLALARALMTNPRLLLLDEPSEGLAPLIVARIGRIIDDLRKHGLS